MKLNQNFIIENLCINRDKPELECNGKCHLQKQLKSVDDEKNEKDAIPTKLINLKIDDFIQDTDLDICVFVPMNDIIGFPLTINLYSFNYINSCFLPPQV